MSVDDQVKLAFASLTDLTKQLITLGTAVLTLQASFAKVFFAQAVDRHWQAPVSWVLLLTSVAAGVWVLMATTGTLSSNSSLVPSAVYGTNIRIPALLQVLLFIAGLGMSIWFGLLASK